MVRPRVVFFGSPHFAVPFLEVIAASADCELHAVVSQPDRPAGRGKQVTQPQVVVAANRLGVPALQPERIRTPEFEAALRGLAPDLFVVVAYGRILPQALLDVPRLGPWNVHASLLPKLRGAAPIQWAIIRGETETGVAVMKMEAGLDTGPVAAVARTPITEDDTAGSLSSRLAELGASLLGATLPAIIDGSATLTPQDGAASTAAPPLKKEDGHLDFSRPAREVSARARGVDPWPGAFASLDRAPLKLFGPHVMGRAGDAPPGAVIGLAPQGLVVACGEGAIAFAELQLPGRKRLPSAAVLAGHPLPPGTSLT
ncbi:MAG TPA: methionyl-tRNA formyltransferase [Polyangia bacterium]|nr:methionyl-tRNA formyltransferase [Polyangia bacterium]